LFRFHFEREGEAPKSEEQSADCKLEALIPETGRSQAERYDYLYQVKRWQIACEQPDRGSLACNKKMSVITNGIVYSAACLGPASDYRALSDA
jgi:hypothetical protein